MNYCPVQELEKSLKFLDGFMTLWLISCHSLCLGNPNGSKEGFTNKYMYSRDIISVTNVQITLTFLILWKEVDRKRTIQ